MQLLIQNPGAAPVEGYTLLGVSTTRNCGVAGTIGQFGSGAKHAINTLLRAGLKLLIYCGKTRLEFATRDDTVNDGLVTKPIKRVVCKLGGTSSKTLDMGWCLDFGAIDWTDLSMALREFVANAIDRTVRERGDFVPALLNEDLRASIVEDGAVRAQDGFTRVYVEVNDDVQRFYGELPRRFLHFSSRPQLVKESLLPKADRNLNGKRTAMIYKEGVLVREIEEAEEASVYDYNFHDGELKLDESRNSSEYDIKGAAARLFRKATPQQLAPVFKSLVAQEQSYEATFDSYYMAPSYSDPEPEQKQAWQQGWELAAGPNAVLCDAALSHTAEFVEKKGFRPKPTKAPSWVTAAARCGVKTAASVLDGHESNGKADSPGDRRRHQRGRNRVVLAATGQHDAGQEEAARGVLQGVYAGRQRDDGLLPRRHGLLQGRHRHGGQQVPAANGRRRGGPLCHRSNGYVTGLPELSDPSDCGDQGVIYSGGSPIAETARQGTQRAGASPARRYLIESEVPLW